MGSYYDLFLACSCDLNLFLDYSSLTKTNNLDPKDIVYLASSAIDLEAFGSLEHIRSLYSTTAPNVKLYYPEPFIASPSFVHNDLGYIHILQYQFWLWFLFVFLICFFFISFIGIVRWCTLRIQPRRETRGVSRSKCGDLITATVPVTWAISIIVSESTDATDYYDGFGTGELIIGVRAYQWGWHYYYPKNVDLNYNVKPNYSTFVGNSLKYNSTTSNKLNTNSLWKFYQSKVEDALVSPAHLLVIPSDNSKILNMLNFRDIGIDTMQASKAFKQIRASARVYTTNLNHNPSYFVNKYNKINSLFFNEKSYVSSNKFSIKRPHNLTSAAATTAVYSTFLDNNSLNRFISHNLQYNVNSQTTSLFNNPQDMWQKVNSKNGNTNSLFNLRFLLQNNLKSNPSALRALSAYPNIVKEFGDNSDVKSDKYVIRKFSRKKFIRPNKARLNDRLVMRNLTTHKRPTSATISFARSHLLNHSSTVKDRMIGYKFSLIDPNFQIQNLYTNTDPNTTNNNLSLGLNSVDSNSNRDNLSSNYNSPFKAYLAQKSNWNDVTTFNKLASNRVVYSNTSPIITNNPLNVREDYSKMSSTRTKTYFNSESGLTPRRLSYILNKNSSLINTPFEDDSDESLEKVKGLLLDSPKPLKSLAHSASNSLLEKGDSNLTVSLRSKKTHSASQLFTAEKVAELQPLTSTYWKMFFEATNPEVRIDHLLSDNRLRKNQILSDFVEYYDYNFNNAIGLRSFENLVWESTHPTPNYSDYLRIYRKYRDFYDHSSYRWGYQNTNNMLLDRDSDEASRFGTEAKSSDKKRLGTFYSNSLQTNDYFVPVHLLNNREFVEYPIISNSLSMGKSYKRVKGVTNLFISKSSLPKGVYNTYNFPQSSHAVLNNFRPNFSGFSVSQDINSKSSTNWLSRDKSNTYEPLKLREKSIKFLSLNSPNIGLKSSRVGTTNVESNPVQLYKVRFSNPIALRRTARSSILTYQAYQKVFKLRYEEGRSHVRLTDYADSAHKQTFTTQKRVKYSRMLGKTRLKYFNSKYNANQALRVFNENAGLVNSLNYYYYEFPFLDGITNDPTRHVWFDAFIKYAQREVSGSSVAKYTLSGVPFFKKKFDYNVKKGRKMADSELYFTRITNARKNYLPLWVYTPYLYTRSKVWFNDTRSKLLTPVKNRSMLNLRKNIARADWYWTKPAFSKTTSPIFTPSFSQTYKSPFRPYTTVHGYQYSLKTLTDILSKREYLYRQSLERRSQIIELPNILRSTPKNPLIKQVKSSFLLMDPITYNSEYSREFWYGSLNYFKFIIFRDFLYSLASSADNLPINIKLINNYLFYHFVPQQSTNSMGDRESLLKSQFKPLKRGISNMMRLQGSGAVALPIEIRLHILASSKDVIHSWAIPSAGIKVDCIPGYSSHRIMIFFTPGIYWGQCMEICGRYHHWMPIIIYFMKRDMFFLWCTHFLSKKDPYATKYWEVNDRQFADYINIVSHNKSSWLMEVQNNL